MADKKKQLKPMELRIYALILFPSVLMIIVSQIDNFFYKVVGLLILFALQALIVKGVVDTIVY